MASETLASAAARFASLGSASKLRQQLGQRRVLVQHGDDQQAHLEAPVAEVGVAQHLVAAEAVEPLDRLADDRGAQVADVHLLGDVGAAVVDEHPPRRRRPRRRRRAASAAISVGARRRAPRR